MLLNLERRWNAFRGLADAFRWGGRTAVAHGHGRVGIGGAKSRKERSPALRWRREGLISSGRPKGHPRPSEILMEGAEAKVPEAAERVAAARVVLMQALTLAPS